MGIINVTGIKVYAYHGCLEEEAIIGGNYVVDVQIHTDFSSAQQSDDLTTTVDYVTVYNIVKAEMAVRSKLIEHVAGRIADSLIKKISGIETARITLHKLNPPMNGDVQEVSVTVEVRGWKSSS
jgi:7,8-dihydroneopterin aldolase/epimerase/oxygenase